MTEQQERAAFLAAIRADPDDDTPRLVFADWLQEHGEDERAEFIRVQCGLAGLPAECERTFCDGQLIVCGDCKRAKKLRRRERELLNLPNGRLGWRIPGWFTNWECRRGFIDSVTCAAADWLEHGDEILAGHPVRLVKLTTFPTEGYPPSEGSPPAPNRVRYPRWPGVEFELKMSLYGRPVVFSASPNSFTPATLTGGRFGNISIGFTRELINDMGERIGAAPPADGDR